MTGRNETLIPTIAEITDIRAETPDVKTFAVLADGKKPFDHKPGQ